MGVANRRWRYGALAAAACISLGCAGPDPGGSAALGASAQTSGTGTQIVMLGTGTPGAEPDRSGPATAILVGDRVYLVDIGPGVVRQAVRAMYLHDLWALEVSNLRVAFVTHLHSDHTAGYPDLILTPWVLGRRVPLQVFGPQGIRAMTQALREAYREDIRVRVEGAEQLPPEGSEVVVTEIAPGVVYEDDRVTVEAFAVPHGSWEHAFGYKFTSADRVVVISGDTGPFEGLAEIARGADVLIHEAYGTAGFQRRAPQNQRYHGTFHTSAATVGEIATAAGVEMVILYHQLHLAGEDPQQLVDEVRSTYDGRVVYGRDLEVY